MLMNATSAAIAGTSDFAFYCSGAPPSTAGHLYVGLGLDPNGRDVGGARMWVSARKRLARIPVVSDAEGFVWTPWGGPLPQLATQIYAQYLFKNPPECPAVSSFSASDALEIAFQ